MPEDIITWDTLAKHLSKYCKYYQKGDYRRALEGFRKLVGFQESFSYYLAPLIYRCEHLDEMPAKISDVSAYGWKGKLKLISIALNKSYVRCKYCGHIEQPYRENFYDNVRPEWKVQFGPSNNSCYCCKKEMPELSIYWDSWEGLEKAEINIEEFNKIRSRYRFEYQNWSAFKTESNLYFSTLPYTYDAWVDYQALILPRLAAFYYYDKGLAQLAHNEDDNQALVFLTEAIKILPDYSEAWLYISYIYDKHGYIEKAEKAKTTGIDKWKKNGLGLLSNGHYKEALVNLEKANKYLQDDAQIWIGRVWALMQLKRWEEAFQTQEIALKFDQKDQRMLKQIRNLWVRINRYDRAWQVYDKEIEISPTEIGLRKEKSHMFDKMGQYDKELLTIDEALKIAPDDSGLWSLRSSALRSLNRINDALKAAESAIELEPKGYFNWWEMAKVYSMSNDRDKTLSCLSKTLEYSGDKKLQDIVKDWLRADPSFAYLKDDKDFITLLK